MGEESQEENNQAQSLAEVNEPNQKVVVTDGSEEQSSPEQNKSQDPQETDGMLPEEPQNDEVQEDTPSEEVVAQEQSEPEHVEQTEAELDVPTAVSDEGPGIAEPLASKPVKHPPYAIVIALLVMSLLVGVGVVAYLNSESTNNQEGATTSEPLPANEEQNATSAEPATQNDVEQELNNIDSSIEELDNLGDPENIDDGSLGI